MYISKVRHNKSCRVINGSVNEYWTSVETEVTISEGEKPEDAIKLAEDFVNAEHKRMLLSAGNKSNGNASADTPDPVKNRQEDKAWERLVKKLEKIEFREDAQEYLDTTEFKLTVDAKKLVNAKPLKNK